MHPIMLGANPICNQTIPAKGGNGPAQPPPLLPLETLISFIYFSTLRRTSTLQRANASADRHAPDIVSFTMTPEFHA